MWIGRQSAPASLAESFAQLRSARRARAPVPTRVPRADSLLPLPFSFDNCDVPVDWHIGKPLDLAAGFRPLHFQPVHLGARARSQYHPRIVRRKIASPTNFEAVPLQLSCPPGDLRADGVDIGLAAHQL